MLDDILFAPAHLFDQMEVERDFERLFLRLQAVVSKDVRIDEIFCCTGSLGQYFINNGYVWKGWDEDVAMLERVMLKRGFQYSGLGGWQLLPEEGSELILGCFAPFSHIEPEALDNFVQHLHRALTEGGCCILQHWMVEEIIPLHRSYNGAAEKWVAMSVPKREGQCLHFSWHWMGAKGKGPVQRFVTEDKRYLHRAEDIESAAFKAGFKVELRDGLWLFHKETR